MNNAFGQFNAEALEALDFARCQRPDGSYYGTGGQCRKGAPVGAKEKAESKGKKLTEKQAVKAMMKTAGVDVDDAKEYVEILKEGQGLNNGRSWMEAYQSAKTDAEREQFAQRAKAEMDDDYLLTKSINKAQKAQAEDIELGIERAENGDGDFLMEVAYNVMERGGIVSPNEREMEQLALSWTGREDGLPKSW